MSTTLSSHQLATSHQALEVAAEWFALLRSGEASDADRDKWQHWVNATEENRAAWQYVERISGRFLSIQQSEARRHASDTFQNARQRLNKRRQVLFGLTAAIGSGVAGWNVWRHTPVASMSMAWIADYHTALGEVRELALSDGTQIWLGTSSAFNQRYANDLRLLDMVRGEMLIQTAADAARPFVVDSPHGRMRALGTRFTVRLHEQHTLLAVHQGAVRIHAKNDDVVVIKAGEETTFTANGIGRVEPVNPAREASARGILIAQNMPLEALVSELSRYTPGHIGVDPTIAHLPVFGSYPARDLERTLNMLTSVMPIQVKRPFAWWTTLSAKDETTKNR